MDPEATASPCGLIAKSFFNGTILSNAFMGLRLDTYELTQVDNYV